MSVFFPPAARRIALLAAALLALAPAAWAVPLSPAARSLLDGYAREIPGFGGFSAAHGEALYRGKHVTSSGDTLACATCHGEDLRAKGKHVRTGKVIDPMAPSVNKERLTDVKFIETWFKRNCKWVVGRECSPQEKGDLLSYLRKQ